jgi:hypothetical protein
MRDTGADWPTHRRGGSSRASRELRAAFLRGILCAERATPDQFASGRRELTAASRELASGLGYLLSSRSLPSLSRP